MIIDSLFSMDVEARRTKLRLVLDAYEVSRAPQLYGSPSLSPNFMQPLIDDPTWRGLRVSWRSLRHAVESKQAGHPDLSPTLKAGLAILSGVALITTDILGVHPHHTNKTQSERRYNFLAAQYGIALALSLLSSGPAEAPSPRTDIAKTLGGERRYIGGEVVPEEPTTNGKGEHPVEGTYLLPPREDDPFIDSDN